MQRRKLVPEVARNSVARADGMSSMAQVHRRSADDPLMVLRRELGLN